MAKKTTEFEIGKVVGGGQIGGIGNLDFGNLNFPIVPPSTTITESEYVPTLNKGGGGTDDAMGAKSFKGSSSPQETQQDVAGTQTGSGELEYTDLDPAKLTANPLPSMPSISNVGAAPFTGSINWNAIPGGFQPLPQVAGGKKKLYQLSQFHGGINQKSSPRDISDQECQEATNVTVSQIGRIKPLGTITGTDNGLETGDLASSSTHIPSPGYGLYAFKSGYSLEASPTQGDYTIVASTDGEHVVVKDSTTEKTDADTWLTIANEPINVAPVFYAAGNGLYVNDANLIHTTSRKAAILVYRKDYSSSGESSMTTKVWSTGKALIDSPTYDTAATDGSVNLEWDDIGAGSNVAFYTTTASGGGTKVEGAATVHIGSDADNSGNWNGQYYFYISWLFDNGCETGLTSLVTTGGTVPVFSDEQLEFNFSYKDNNSARNYIGGDARIHGARIYFRESGTNERYLLAEISVTDGIKGALDSTFTPWKENSDIFYLENNMIFNSPPSIYTYVSLNGYYANEVYDKSPETLADNTTGPVAHDVRYRTATVGSNGATFIGCYMYKGKVFADGMMYSLPNKPAVFPEYNVYDSPSSDGTPITALVSFKDKILQFKQDALYVINISNPSQFYTEASFRNCGVMNPCQTFMTPFGVIFANYIGCFIYDGQKVISLTSGKFTDANWGISEGSVVDTASGKDAVNVPCVGYDPRSQSIIVLKDVGHTVNNDAAWIYHMGTQSWTESSDMIANADGVRHSNFIVSPNGYLSICQSDVEALKNYKLGNASTQTITYWTKDLDFGMPSQTKKLFKVYITYKGDASSLKVKYAVDGHDRTYSEEADYYQFNNGSSNTDTPLLDKNSATDIENWHVAELTPAVVAEGKDWKSMSLWFNGSVDDTFEIQDISILYRARPIK